LQFFWCFKRRLLPLLYVIEMYVRGDGRDLTTSFEEDPNFVLRTLNMVISSDNGTIVGSFINSGK
jgi:hypothetical protein